MTYAQYPLTEAYSIPKGALVCPSINAANMQVTLFPPVFLSAFLPCAHSIPKGADVFDPERAHPPTLRLPLPVFLQGWPRADVFDPERMGPECCHSDGGKAGESDEGERPVGDRGHEPLTHATPGDCLGKTSTLIVKVTS